MIEAKLTRYADRKGCMVHWGNIIGGFLGQEFKETFKTEAEAIERERQALANEIIEIGRYPRAIKTDKIR